MKKKLSAYIIALLAVVLVIVFGAPGSEDSPAISVPEDAENENDPLFIDIA